MEDGSRIIHVRPPRGTPLIELPYLAYKHIQQRLHLQIQVEQVVGFLDLGRGIYARLDRNEIRRLWSLLELVRLRIRVMQGKLHIFSGLDEVPDDTVAERAQGE